MDNKTLEALRLLAECRTSGAGSVYFAGDMMLAARAVAALERIAAALEAGRDLAAQDDEP